MQRLIDLTGKRFGKLVVLSHADVNKSKHHRWNCLCDCGNEKVVEGQHLRSGATKSCGCNVGSYHGMSGTREYNIWRHMIDRCINPNSNKYSYYGERGITVCSEWYLFDNFIRDMGVIPEGKTSIDRIDNNKGYYKENCRWADAKIQGSNRRTVIYVTIDGITDSLMGTCKRLGLNYKAVHNRIYNGKDIYESLY